jgi:hypothetical protein
MPSGFIRILGENFPKPQISIEDNLPDEKRSLRKQLVFVQQSGTIQAKHTIDYQIIVCVAGRKLTLFKSQLFKDAQHKYKSLVSIARKEKSCIEIQFYSNDFLVEKYQHE